MTLSDLWLALTLMVVIEGLIYALFPRGIKSMMAKMCQLPDEAVRMAGLLFATIGMGVLWVLVYLR